MQLLYPLPSHKLTLLSHRNLCGQCKHETCKVTPDRWQRYLLWSGWVKLSFLRNFGDDCIKKIIYNTFEVLKQSLFGVLLNFFLLERRPSLAALPWIPVTYNDAQRGVGAWEIFVEWVNGWLLGHRCANCFDCPGCMHTLSTRATSISTQLPDDPAKTAVKKAYYLACGFCRWTSRDVGMADKSVGEWGGPQYEVFIGSAVIAHKFLFLLLVGRQELDSECFVINSSFLPNSHMYGPWRFRDWVNHFVFLMLVK